MQHLLRRLVLSVKIPSLLLFFIFALQAAVSITMRFFQPPMALFTTTMLANSAHSLSANASVDLTWYPPISSDISNLSSAINGTGTYGFIFNSSTLPAGVPYGEMFLRPSGLVYSLIIMTRHI